MFYLSVNSQNIQFNKQPLSKMRGSSLIRYSPQKLYGKSFNFIYLRKQGKKTRESDLLAFNDQIIKGNSSCDYSLQRKASSAQALQQKKPTSQQNISKSVILNATQTKHESTRQILPKFQNPKNSSRKRIKVQRKANKPSLNDNLCLKQKQFFSQNQLSKSTSSQEGYAKIPKNTFFIKRYPSNHSNQDKKKPEGSTYVGKTLERVEPWTTTQQIMNETLNIKTEASKEAVKYRKPSKLKKMMYKVV